MKGSHAMRGEAFAAFAALVIACSDPGTWERIGDYLRNMQKDDPAAFPILTGTSIEAIVKEGCTVVDRRGAYEIRDSNRRVRYQCAFLGNFCRWIKGR